MRTEYTHHPLLEPLRRQLPKPVWQNLVALVLALQLGRTFVLRQLALYVLCVVSSESCYRRLERVLAWEQERYWQPLRRTWVRAVLTCFAPGRGTVPMIIDWTWHAGHCQSLWLQLPVGGRAVPLCFWLMPAWARGRGSQRALEDAALRELRECLPGYRPVLLIGDRGFRGRDRIRFLQQLGWHFVLRVTAETQIEVQGQWVALAALAPEIGARWQRAGVRLGKPGKDGPPVLVQVVAVRQAHARPKAVRTAKGNRSRPTGATLTDTTWYLATDLPLGIDAVAVYAWRMQIEQTFRDFKALLGLETERTAWERLPALLWALTIGVALDLQLGNPQARVPSLPRVSPQATAAPAGRVALYPSQSATREGLHVLVVQVILGTSPFTADLEAMQAKSRRMCQRPQVSERRRTQPARRKRRRQAESRLQA